MSVKIVYTLGLVVVLSAFTSVRAADGDKPKGGGKNLPGMLLEHADELGLTADQKAKLQDMAKGPMGILTDEQKTKAKELMQKAQGGDGKKGKKEGGGDAKKPEEKKPEDKKPEEKKEEK
ncbi:MAG: hypothetical protein WCT04_09900 [Planctomycetota bacterium]